jgi:transposase-like protein
MITTAKGFQSHFLDGPQKVLHCKYCNSEKIIRKGKAERKDARVQVWLCKSCKKRFTANKVKYVQYSLEEIAEAYIFHFTSLDSLLKVNSLEISRSTLYRKLREIAKRCPDWEDIATSENIRNKWGYVMGIDTTTLKIKGIPHVYLQVVDIPSKDAIAYEICTREDKSTIKSILMNLKSIGYYPRVVMSDLAPELLYSIQEVFPEAEIQGCLFHLCSLLDKKLPTKKILGEVSQERIKVLENAKKFIIYMAVSKNESERLEWYERLKSLPFNKYEELEDIIKSFKGNLRYYKTLDTLKTLNINKEWLYNNLSERYIGLIKSLAGRMRGFKSREAAHDFIKMFWWLKRMKQAGLPFNSDGEQLTRQRQSLLSFFSDHMINLVELSRVTGIPLKELSLLATRSGLILGEKYAFKLNFLENIKSRFCGRVKNLDDLMRATGYNQEIATELLYALQTLGVNCRYESFAPSGTIILW